MKTLFSILFVLIAGAANAQKADSLAKLEKPDYTILFPSNWRVDTSGWNNTEFIIFSPKEHAGDNFSENVLLMIEDMTTDPLELDEYVESSAIVIKENAKDLKNFNQTKLRSVSGEFYKVSYDMTAGIYQVHTIQYYFVKNKKAYIVNFSSENGNMKEKGEEIMRSFSITAK